MELTATSAPACPSAKAIALPIPELAPVTSAFCPFKIFKGSTSGLTTSGSFSLPGFFSIVLIPLFDSCARLLYQFGDQRRPPRLPARPQPLAAIAMKILVELQQVF